MRIAFLTPHSHDAMPPEEQAAWLWLEQSTHEASILQLDSLPSLGHFDVLWWHSITRVHDHPQAMTNDIMGDLIHFINGGGALLLTLMAAEYVHTLGIESSPPDRIEIGHWQTDTIMALYPDMRGFHGFLRHPLFDGLHGGVYTWLPQNDEPYHRAVYSKDRNPANGTILALERARITMIEDSKCIIAYQHGDGKVLTIGTHLYFAPQVAEFRTHRDRFLANVFMEITNPDGLTAAGFTYSSEARAS